MDTNQEGGKGRGGGTQPLPCKEGRGKEGYSACAMVAMAGARVGGLRHFGCLFAERNESRGSRSWGVALVWFQMFTCYRVYMDVRVWRLCSSFAPPPPLPTSPWLFL